MASPDGIEQPIRSQFKARDPIAAFQPLLRKENCTMANREGYKKRGIDVVGFWNPELGEIHCIPRAAKLFDSQLNKSRPSTLLIVELVDPCSAITAKDEDGDSETVATKKGDLVGIWGKPGMAAIKTLCGEPTLIEYDKNPDGTIKVKAMKQKGMNAMKLFSVSSAKNPMRVIPVVEDARRESAHVNTLLAGAKSSKPLAPLSDAPASAPGAAPEDDDDVPF